MNKKLQIAESPLLDHIKALGLGSYQEVRTLEDGSIVGIGNLMFTRAIYMDMNLNGWGRRFCFEDKALADQEFQRLMSDDDTPTGWIATRNG